MKFLRRPAVLSAAAACLLLASAGCSAFTGAVEVAAPSPSGDAARACRALDGALPGSVDGLPGRETDPASRWTAAWGDPAVTLRCGVPKPEVLTPGSEQYNPTSESVEVDGVQWLPEDVGDGYRFTTLRREADVEVFVPHAHAPGPEVLVDLAEAVGRAVPRTS
ncbi:DUF3515 domain-containing protein [Streptomyces sp. SCUT-3]|uniref:DUF3515 domain-containing protein n=1 Tax=Streptomyces sp. SCUT-3 TaxID=2684469 RepID=UPI002174DD14|nr:DUF3515 domain-containing protein [Streptomyces sp. SCUT-3]